MLFYNLETEKRVLFNSDTRTSIVLSHMSLHSCTKILMKTM